MRTHIDLNQLPTEVKILIANAQALVDKTRAGVKEKRTEVDLTGKFQLKDDCKAIEKVIDKMKKGKVDSKTVRELELATTRLKTTAGALLKIDV